MQLFTILDSDTYDKAIEFTTHAQLSQHETSKNRQKGKFNKLKTRLQNHSQQQESAESIKDRWVKNLSNRVLSDNETKVLCKGLNFAVTPNSPPVVEIITATESAIRSANIGDSKASELRHAVNNILSQSKQVKPNVTKAEQQAIKDLKSDKSIAIVPADKGRCTVLLNECDYDKKCQDLLKDTKTYKKIGYNPTSGYTVP